ncbi:SIR2 family protein [Clostridioides difficile]
MFTNVKEKLKSLGISPIFFVGSGISRRYIDSPNWLGLLEETISDTDINFERLKQKHSNREDINMEELAKELEDLYYDKLPDECIESGRNKPYYYRKKIADIINQYLENKKSVLFENEEIKELKKTNPAVIITTNYDELLEVVFGEEYTVHIGQTSLLTSILDGVGEIYKIHGCVSEPDSIVVTKDDYDNFFEKDIYLNSKLLTLFLEYPIVFLGYSVSDRNVKSVLTTIVKMLPQDKVEELKSRIWFIKRPKPDEVDGVTKERIRLEDGLYIDVDAFSLNNYGDFYKAISDITIKRLPIRFLKFLKNNVYELVASQEYNPKLLNVNIEDLNSINDFNELNNFVGLTFSTRERRVLSSKVEICKAFMYDEYLDYEPTSVLSYRLERRTKTPFYKFIKDLDANEILTFLENTGGKDCELYEIIKNDNQSYVINIGREKENIVYEGELTVQNINTYVNNYIKNYNLQTSQSEVVKRYTILYILRNRLHDLSENQTIYEYYKNEIIKCITNLPEEYIRESYTLIINILQDLDNQSYTAEFRKALCFIDRTIFRPQIKNINKIGYLEV